MFESRENTRSAAAEHAQAGFNTQKHVLRLIIACACLNMHKQVLIRKSML